MHGEKSKQKVEITRSWFYRTQSDCRLPLSALSGSNSFRGGRSFIWGILEASGVMNSRYCGKGWWSLPLFKEMSKWTSLSSHICIHCMHSSRKAVRSKRWRPQQESAWPTGNLFPVVYLAELTKSVFSSFFINFSLCPIAVCRIIS